MPPNTVYVGRGTRYGNPYTVKEHGRDNAMTLFRAYIKKKIASEPLFLVFLKGKNLACWCKPGELCHADILLELANK